MPPRSGEETPVVITTLAQKLTYDQLNKRIDYQTLPYERVEIYSPLKRNQKREKNELQATHMHNRDTDPLPTTDRKCFDMFIILTRFRNIIINIIFGFHQTPASSSSSTQRGPKAVTRQGAGFPSIVPWSVVSIL